MIEQQVINGQNAIVAYLDDQFNPVEPDKATLKKIMYENGDMEFVAIKAATPVEGS